jgi:Flp pilus assembly protein TadB
VSSGFSLDRALCALLVLLSLAALLFGALTGDPALIGMAVFGLAGAAWVACVLFDSATRRRERAVREALDRVWR